MSRFFVRRLDRRPRQHLESQPEPVGQLVLPLLHQAAGRHDQAPLHVAAQHQLPDQQPRHDRLARTGIVSQHEPHRALGQ